MEILGSSFFLNKIFIVVSFLPIHNRARLGWFNKTVVTIETFLNRRGLKIFMFMSISAPEIWQKIFFLDVHFFKSRTLKVLIKLASTTTRKILNAVNY